MRRRGASSAESGRAGEAAAGSRQLDQARGGGLLEVAGFEAGAEKRGGGEGRPGVEKFK